MRKLTSVFSILALVLVSMTALVAQSPQSVGVNANAAATVVRYDGSTGRVHWDNWVTITARHADGTVFAERHIHNIVTNAGFDLIAAVVSGTSAQPAACNYIAVTNSAITPAAGDTTLSGEIAANGLSRAIGTYNHTNGTQTYTVAKTFTASGTQASQATGMFNAASTGTMCFEATYTPVTVNNGDTLTVTWTITLS